MNKSHIHAACIARQLIKIDELQNAINNVQESIVGEENSTAGNKFETARAMGQEEMDRLNKTMSIAQRELMILNNINPAKPCNTAQLGAVVTTDQKEIYMAVGLGRLVVDSKTYFVISSSSPIGLQLIGKSAGSTIKFAGKTEKIISIV